jgi:transcriptional regulator with XRE-family HTH domain
VTSFKATDDKVPKPLHLHVGARVRMRRKFLCLSQTDLADAIGLTFHQVQKYERGSNRISAPKLYDISKFLKAPVAYFFEGYAEGETPEGFSESDGAVSLMLTCLRLQIKRKLESVLNASPLL